MVRLAPHSSITPNQTVRGPETVKVRPPGNQRRLAKWLERKRTEQDRRGFNSRFSRNLMEWPCGESEMGDERGFPKIKLRKLLFESTWPKVVGQGLAGWCPEVLGRKQLKVESSGAEPNSVTDKSWYQVRLPLGA